jgi:outer membrane protein assembly factor BamB
MQAHTVLTLASFLGALAVSSAAEWNQFRGPNASGVSTATNIPVEFGPETNVVWKTSIPGGHSSPSLGTDRIFVTSVENDKLYTIAVNRADGRVLWRREAPRPRKQTIERPANGPVSATPATDGKNVYVFFQDFGIPGVWPRRE